MSVLGGDRRLRHLHARRRFLFLALDHGLPAGPLPGIERPGELLRSLVGVPFSGIIANPGMVRFLTADLPQEWGLIVHLSAGTLLGSNRGSKVLASSVERAVALGADAVSVQIHFGDRQEDRMLSDAGRVVDEASSRDLPVLVMAYASAKPGDASVDSVASAHAARVAAEIGASIVQSSYAGSPEGIREIVRGCPVPVVLAGGPRSASEEAFLVGLSAMILAGAAGIAVGRQVFQATNPAAMARRIADVVSEREEPLVVEAVR